MGAVAMRAIQISEKRQRNKTQPINILKIIRTQHTFKESRLSFMFRSLLYIYVSFSD
jgi:hypothetical protein